MRLVPLGLSSSTRRQGMSLRRANWEWCMFHHLNHHPQSQKVLKKGHRLEVLFRKMEPSMVPTSRKWVLNLPWFRWTFLYHYKNSRISTEMPYFWVLQARGFSERPEAVEKSAEVKKKVFCVLYLLFVKMHVDLWMDGCSVHWLQFVANLDYTYCSFFRKEYKWNWIFFFDYSKILSLEFALLYFSWMGVIFLFASGCLV